MIIVPRGQAVLIKKQDVIKERKIGSIIIPAQNWSMNEDTVPAKIITVGPLVDDLREGDMVLIGRFAGIQVSEEETIVDQEDIIAIMRDEEPGLSTLGGRRVESKTDATL